MWKVALDPPVAPGATARLELGYDAVVPERYDTFGCVDGGCTLVGGFYPMLAAHDAGGWDLDAPPMRGAIDVEVLLPRPGAIVLFDQWSGNDAARMRHKVDDAAWASLLIAPRWYSTVRIIAAGTLIVHMARHPPPPADDARGQILPYTLENYTRYEMDVVERALGLIHEAGALQTQPRFAVRVVEVPLRMNLAEAVPGLVLVSDRWYRIWPARRFRKFHDRELVRAVGAHVLGKRIAAAGNERPADLELAADFTGAWLADVDTMKQHSKSEFAGDILRPVSFVPMVDQLLYAPLTMFASAYFGGVVDDEPLRDGPGRFNHGGPRGKLYYEKLKDLMTPDALSATVRGVVADRLGFRAAAEAAWGAPLDWFFRQWASAYPRINYRLGGVKSTEVPGGGWEHAITVVKETPPADAPPVEPVEVAAELDGGRVEVLRWDGAGRQTTLTFRDQARLEKVSIDPRGRLVEAKLPGREQHPLFDNRSSHKTRFVYNSFNVLLNVTDLSALLTLDFTLGRVHDVKNQTRFAAYTSESVLAGVWSEYRRMSGGTRDPDTLVSRAALNLSIERVRAGFFAGDDGSSRGVTRAILGTELRSDDRTFFFEPLWARALAFSADLTLTRRDALAMAEADLLLSGTASLRYTKIFTPWANNTFAVNVSGAAAFGDIQDRSQLLSPSGATGLRGYGPGELFTRSRLMLRAELRHWFAHDLTWNFGHYNLVRGVGATLFADGALLSPCASYNVARRDSPHASVGAGLAFPYDSFGTIPYLMRVDVAVPVVRRDRQCLGSTSGDFPPVMLYISFIPPF
jgi:hypothetical protein